MESKFVKNIQELPNIIELARTLRQENLFIQQEQEAFTNFTDTINESSALVFKLAYICTRQKQYLHEFNILEASNFEQYSAQIACFGNDLKFIEAKEILDYEFVLAYEKLFEFLHQSPIMLTQILLEGRLLSDYIDGEQLNYITNILFNTIFANGINNGDLEKILEMFHYLIIKDIVPTNISHRFLEINNSLFLQLYYCLIDSLLSAKIFLTAALYEPIMNLLCEANIYKNNHTHNNFLRLQTDFNKRNNMGEMGHQSIDYLYQLSKEFINSIKNNWFLFPPTLHQLIHIINNYLTKDDQFKCNDIRGIFVDLIFKEFICRAIEKADIVGIINTPICENVRSLLIEISKIIQILALDNYNEIDEKYIEIRKSFQQNLIPQLIDDLLKDQWNDDININTNIIQNNFQRQILLISKFELYSLTKFLRTIINYGCKTTIKKENYCKLVKLLHQIPECTFLKEQDREQYNITVMKSPIKEKLKSSIININKTKSKVGGKSNENDFEFNKSSNTCKLTDDKYRNYNNHPCFKLSTIREMEKISENHINNILLPCQITRLNNDDRGNEIVLIFYIQNANDQKLKLMTEDEVLLNGIVPNIINKNGYDIGSHFQIPAECKYRLKNDNVIYKIKDLTLVQNDNTSSETTNDEVNSNNSVTSFIELKDNDQNDTSSDMISANSSDTSSRSISGHDIPLSQITDDESVNNMLSTPQTQNLNSTDQSEIDEDKDALTHIPMRTENNGLDNYFVGIKLNELAQNLLNGPCNIQQLQNYSALLVNLIQKDGLLNSNVEFINPNAFEIDNNSIIYDGTNKTNNLNRYQKDAISFITTSSSEQNSLNDNFFSRFFGKQLDKNNVAVQKKINDSNKLKLNNCQDNNNQNIKDFLDINANTDKCTNDFMSLNNSQSTMLHASKKNENMENLPLPIGKEIAIIDNNEELSNNLNSKNNEILSISIKHSSTTLPNLYDSNSVLSDQATSETNLNQMHLLTNNYHVDQSTSCTNILQLQDKSLDDLNNFANNIENNTDIKSTNTTVQKSYKPTGAIPKSISFNSSIEATNADIKNPNSSYMLHHSESENCPDLDTISTDIKSNNSSILNKLKHGIFRNRRGYKIQDNNNNINNNLNKLQSNCKNYSLNTSTHSPLNLRKSNITDNNDYNNYCLDISNDILEKYRQKINISKDEANSEPTDLTHNFITKKDKCYRRKAKEDNLSNADGDTVNFSIIKRKLKLALTTADLHLNDFQIVFNTTKSPLLTYLHKKLAQAINIQNFQQMTYLSEAIKSLTGLNDNQHIILLKELVNDAHNRYFYLQYLISCRQKLSIIIENFKEYEIYLRKKIMNYSYHLLANFLRLFINKRKRNVDNFLKNFSTLTAYDDKIDLIEEFIIELMDELLLPVTGVLHGKSEYYIIEARNILELMLLERVYQQVLFPNDDADLSRDLVLAEHISKLQYIISPEHPSLSISKEFLHEAPWEFAQQQLSYITAYITPKDKLQCVNRCITSITNLLNLSSNRIPSADDILPVLIYIVIMAKPPSLLSTIEYINCFIGDKLNGEDQFYWTLFGSVVKYIKTMDYNY